MCPSVLFPASAFLVTAPCCPGTGGSLSPSLLGRRRCSRSRGPVCSCCPPRSGLQPRTPAFQHCRCSCVSPAHPTGQALQRPCSALCPAGGGGPPPLSPGSRSVCPWPPAWARVTLRSADPPLCLGLGRLLLDVRAPKVLPCYCSFEPSAHLSVLVVEAWPLLARLHSGCLCLYLVTVGRTHT